MSTQKTKPKFNRDERDYIQDLEQRNSSLVAQHKSLKNKLKNASSVTKRLKKEIQDLQRKCNHYKSGNAGASTVAYPLLKNRRTGDSRHDDRIKHSSLKRNGSNNSQSDNVSNSLNRRIKANRKEPSGCRTSVSTNYSRGEEEDGDSDEAYSFYHDQHHNEEDNCDTAHVLGQMQQRLLDADEEIRRLRTDNERLGNAARPVSQGSNTSRASGASSVHIGNMFMNSSSRTATSGNTFASSRHSNHDNNSTALMIPEYSHVTNTFRATEIDSNNDINSQLHETQTGLHTLQIQYNSLETTSKIQLQIHKQTRAKLDECNAYISKLQEELQRWKEEYQVIKEDAVVGEGYRGQYEELVVENRGLEEKLSNLCDLQFRSGTGPRNIGEDGDDEFEEDRSDIERGEKERPRISDLNEIQVQELEQEVEHYKRQVEVLTNDIITYEANTVSLQGDKEELALDCAELGEQVCELREELDSNLIELKLKQIAISSRNMSTQTSEDTANCCCIKSLCGESDVEMIESKNEPQELQVRSNSKTGVNKILPSGENIVQTEENENPANGDNNVARFHQIETIDKLQEISMQRLDRIRQLEVKLKLKAGPQQGDYALDVVDELGANENVLRLSIIKCAFDTTHTLISEEAQTIVVMNVLNFESQASTVGMGLAPSYKLNASFKFQHSDFLMEELKRRSCSLEIYQVGGLSCIQFLGRSLFHFKDLCCDSSFSHGDDKYKYDLNIISCHSNASIGDMTISAKLLRPLQVSGLPTDNIETGSCSDLHDLGPLQLNEIEVRINTRMEHVNHCIEEIWHDDSRGLYLEYVFLGFQNTFAVNHSSGGGDSGVSHMNTKVFPIEITPGLIRTMSGTTSFLEFNLYSSKEEDDGNVRRSRYNGLGALLGTGKVNIDKLGKGQEISTLVNIVSTSKKGLVIRSMDLQMRWLHQLHPIVNLEGDKIEPEDLREAVIEYFSNKANESVDYISFLRYVDPPPQIYKHITVIIKHEDSLCHNLKSIDTSNGIILEEEFSRAVESLSELIVRRDEAIDIFNYINTKNHTRNPGCRYDDVFHFLFSRQLQHIRLKLHIQKRENMNATPTAHIARNLFKKVDYKMTGYIKEKEFLDILELLGLII